MNLRYLLIFTLTIGLLNHSCRFGQGGNSGGDVRKEPESAIYNKTYYDKQGRLFSKVTMVDDVLHGPSVSFYTDGTKNTEVSYVNGKKEGQEVKFYGTGEPYRERTYREGVIDGWEKRYYKNGQVMSEVFVRKGEYSNDLKEYNHDGRLIKTYPEIVFRMVHNRDYPGEVILQVNLSNKSKNVEFYRGKLKEGKYFSASDLQRLPGPKGTGEIALNRQDEGQPFHIVAKYITTRHTPCFITGSYVYRVRSEE